MIEIFGVSKSLSEIVNGSSTKASLGGVSGVAIEVTQNGAAPIALLAIHPAGKAGATTPSKFSLKARPAQGVPEGAAVDVAVAVAVEAGVDVAVVVAVAVGVALGVELGQDPSTTESVSIRQPGAETLLSDPIRKRSLMV